MVVFLTIYLVDDKLEDTVTSILTEDVDVIIYSKWWYWDIIDAAIELGNLTKISSKNLLLFDLLFVSIAREH